MICLALVVITIDNTILNVALPTIVRELDATGSQLQWIVDSYVIVFACLLLTAGALGDKFGRKGALMCGVALFGAFSALASFATSPDRSGEGCDRRGDEEDRRDACIPHRHSLYDRQRQEESQSQTEQPLLVRNAGSHPAQAGDQQSSVEDHQRRRLHGSLRAEDPHDQR